MPIRVECKCGNKFGAPSKYAGKKVKCPKCSDPLVIPKNSTTDKPDGKKIAVKCKCGKAFAAKPELKGKTVRCPGCKSPIKIGAATKQGNAQAKQGNAEPKAVQSPLDDDDPFADVGLVRGGPGKKCPECSQSMAEEAIICIDCGYNENLGRKMSVYRPVTQEDRERAYEEKTLTGEVKSEKKRKK